jgi:(1->4)-alpha-D-glucan 1-alpha-D-glucosylmutase
LRLEWPRSLLAGTTHDTKRSADVRARIGVLAGLADRWAEAVTRWRGMNAHDGAPDWTEELLVYQTLVGAWPLEPERLEAYVEKALREAKRNTSWLEPDEAWEAGAKRFCRGLYGNDRFLADFEPFAADVAAAGQRAALGQLVLRFTSPGVPDIYQGDEHTLLALVDPDNRRPVDWASRTSPKSELVRTLLALRARRPESFAGGYEPLAAPEGTCAYRRGEDVAVAVPFRGGRPELELPPGPWQPVLDEPYARVFERA